MPQPPSPNPAETYEQYFVPGMFARWAPLLLLYAAPQPGERVLDVACGTGIVARQAAPAVGESGTVVGVDASPQMLAVARAAAPAPASGIEWRQGDATALPDGPFDLVTCQHGLQFFPDRPAALREMHRVLAPKGRVAISTWKRLDEQPVYPDLCEAQARHLGTSVEAVAGPPFSLGDEHELQALLDDAGFARVEVKSTSRTVRFPEPERFVMLTTLSTATVVPEFAKLDDASRSALVETVSHEIEGTLEPYVDGDEIVFPMHANVAVAYA